MSDRQFDSSVRPQDDYFGYVNNVWLKANPVPPTENSWGTFYVLRDQASSAVHAIFKELSDTPEAKLNHDQRLLKIFYETALSFDSYRQNHLETIKDHLSAIDQINDHTDMARVIGQLHRNSQSAFWTLYVDHDDKNSQLHVLRFHQSGLTLPNRDYYLDKTEHMRTIRQKYQDFHAKIHQHLPEIVSANFETINTIESNLAKQAWTNVELRDVEKNYNRYTLTELKAEFALDWQAYFDGLGWSQPNDHIVIGQPSYLRAVCQMLQEQTIDDTKAYLRWRAIQGLANWIDQSTAQLVFDFFGTTLGGVNQIKPLWKRTVNLADSLIIGEAIGREYVARYFPESSKKAILEMVEDVRQAYHARLKRLSWMSPATKKKAHKKLDNMKVLVGYPSKWKDLSKLQFNPDNHIENILRARQFDADLELAKIGQVPADEQWEMHAHTVNAYHHPNRLEIVFPAAILQPPFYDPKASYATNLGGIGAVIGHELTHGFDDQGADFDELGNTNRWQSQKERQEFEERAKTIIDQANQFEAAPGVFLQGKLILGEAIADIGGLALAVETLKRSVKSSTNTKQQMEELFVNFARCDCGHATLERAIELAKIDPHPPSRFRINNVVCHEDDFYDTYQLKPGDKLYLPAKSRVKIW